MARNPLWTVAALSLLAGCGGEDVAHYRVPKGSGSPAPSALAAMAAASPAGAPPAADAPAGGLRWTLPKGWTEDRSAGGMRYATLKAPAAGKLDVSVTVFPGPAGGELANVNRWRNQIGLPPLEEADLARDRKALKAPGGTLALFDYASTDKKSRMVAAILVAGGNSWFVKMVGDAGPVAASRPDFVRILESLRLGNP